MIDLPSRQINEFSQKGNRKKIELVTRPEHCQIINVESGEETGVKCPLKEYLESDCTNLVGLYNRMKVRDIKA